MKTVPWNVYAPSRRRDRWLVPGLTWAQVDAKVRRLQVRIAQAARLKQYRRLSSLQWLLAHSFYGRLLAVRRVTSRKGKNTPGVDGVVWKSVARKMQAVKTLYRRGYRAQPLRRVYIPKKSGTLRPLGIPTMRDRAMQALYALTLEPVAETWADPNSYGFRPGRSCADAMQQCHQVLNGHHRAQWVLEADIAACFDNISHRWMMENIPVDKRMLSQWLKAGYVDGGMLYPTLAGTPQGGVISPLLMNMTLDGLERTVKRSATWYMPGTKIRSGINFIRYADDFIVTAKRRGILTDKVLPAIRSFFSVRGLTLSETKTRITRIWDGFNFLGQHVKKYGPAAVLIKPAAKAVRSLKAALRDVLTGHDVGDTWGMIRRLNQILGGWCAYHRHACSSRIFNAIDGWLFRRIKHWLHARHPNKGRRWVLGKYYRREAVRRLTFHAVKHTSDGQRHIRDLLRAARTHIIRHVKVKSEANPYDPAWNGYFRQRVQIRRLNNRDSRFSEETGWLWDKSHLRRA